MSAVEVRGRGGPPDIASVLENLGAYPVEVGWQAVISPQAGDRVAKILGGSVRTSVEKYGAALRERGENPEDVYAGVIADMLATVLVPTKPAPRTSVMSFLTGVAHHKVVDILRAKTQPDTFQLPLDDILLATITTTPPDRPDFDEEAMLAKLSARQRRFVERRLEGKKPAEIARLEDPPVKLQTVITQLERAAKKFPDLMKALRATPVFPMGADYNPWPTTAPEAPLSTTRIGPETAPPIDKFEAQRAFREGVRARIRGGRIGEPAREEELEHEVARREGWEHEDRIRTENHTAKEGLRGYKEGTVDHRDNEASTLVRSKGRPRQIDDDSEVRATRRLRARCPVCKTVDIEDEGTGRQCRGCGHVWEVAR